MQIVTAGLGLYIQLQYIVKCVSNTKKNKYCRKVVTVSNLSCRPIQFQVWSIVSKNHEPENSYLFHIWSLEEQKAMFVVRFFAELFFTEWFTSNNDWAEILS